MVPVVTVKVPEVAAAATLTDAGTVNVALVFDRVTLAPPVGAAWVRVTVQVLEELAPRALGLQDNVETNTGVTTDEAGLSAAICIVQPLVAEAVAA